MRTSKRLLVCALITIVIMGPSGMEGLSKLSGITITSGFYDIREDGVRIRAKGIDKAEVYWEVLGLCKMNGPIYIILYNPKVNI